MAPLCVLNLPCAGYSTFTRFAGLRGFSDARLAIVAGSRGTTLFHSFDKPERQRFDASKSPLGRGMVYLFVSMLTTTR